ncbi:lantibiotic dehydratase [Nocardiopsis nanhaiensis]
MPPAPLYRHHGGLLLRASATSDAATPPPPAPGESLLWLQQIWSDESVRQAVEAANPVLYGRVGDLLGADDPPRRAVDKAITSLLGYLARRRRPTPFGLFAGAAPITVSAVPSVKWGDEHRVHTGADHAWISEVIDRLHACPELMGRIPVMSHTQVIRRGGRLVVPGPAAGGRTRRAAPVEVTIRAAPPAVTALELARAPLPHQVLTDRLAEQFPSAPHERVAALVDELLAQGFLVSGLWAPSTVPDALGHLCQVLEQVGAHDIPEAADLLRRVRSLHTRLDAPSTHTQWKGKAPLRRVMLGVSEVSPVPLTADTTLDCQVSVPPPVVAVLEQAAGLLIRTSAQPFGSPIWREYHHRFRDRYGPGAAVPVMEVVADSGIGWPAGYLGADRFAAPTVLTDRDTLLLEEAQKALAGGGDLVLTDDLVDRLGRANGAPLVPPDRVEIAARVHAPTLAAVEKGEFSVWVTAAPRPASSMFGRFLGLLDSDDRRPLVDSFAARVKGAVAAQVSFHARQRRNDNLTRTPPITPLTISLGEHRSPGEGVIDLEDLAVVADATGLGLVRLSTGQRVITRTAHPLEPQNQTPPLARFLAEIPHARCAFYGAFDLGAAARLAHVPRIRYGPVVLSPARWTLTAADVPGRDADQDTWDQSLSRWRHQWGVPGHIAVVEHDRQLPLDLTEAAHRHLLRRHLHNHDLGQVRVCEAPTPEQVGWIGRPHELVAALHTTLTPARPWAKTRPLAGGVVDSPLSGGPVVHARVPVHPDRADPILTDHLPTLIEAAGCDRWWYRIRRDTARVDAPTHLEVTLRTPAGQEMAAVVEAAHSWAYGLRETGLAPGAELVPHHPQHTRYGHGEAFRAAEAVFTADSSAALAQRRLAQATGADPVALTAASLADLTAHLLGGHEAGDRWLVHDLEHTPGRVATAVRTAALAWATPANSSSSELWATPTGEAVPGAWHTRGHALDLYRRTLETTGRDPAEVTRSLLHLHHARARGVDPDGEAAVLRAARAIALTRTHRRSP